MALLTVVVVGIPWGLVTVARARFGGGAPFHGVPGPAEWDATRVRAALTDQLTEQTVADVVIRGCLALVWIVVGVLVITVFAELVHMIRHDGLALPDVRGLGWSQSTARVVAVGLLVVVPMFGSARRASARGDLLPVPAPAAQVESAVSVATRPENRWIPQDPPAPAVDQDLRRIDRAAPTADEQIAGVGTPPAVSPGIGPYPPEVAIENERRDQPSQQSIYVVRPGDSIYGIAERVVGPDDAVEYAEQLLDQNLGRPMVDGRRFTNAAYIEIGWRLELPSWDGVTVARRSTATEHVVERGESLWSIADDELGDARRWPEIFEANEGRVFESDRALDDPDLIQPGWTISIPGDDPEPVEPSVPSEDVPVPAVPPVDSISLDAGDVGRSESGPADAEVSDAPTAAGDTAGSAQPENVWAPPSSDPAPPLDAVAAHDTSSDSGDDARPVPDRNDDLGVELLTPTRAAMLSAGVLALLAVRRRNQLRRARPRARLPEGPTASSETERAMRTIDAGDRFHRVEIAIRAVALRLVVHAVRVVAAIVDDDGALDLIVDGPVMLGAPWVATGDVTRWRLPAATPIELLASDASRVGVPCPTLVQLGRSSEGSDVYVDLEALGVIEIGGSADQADAVVRAIAATLAGSALAEVTTLVGLGIDGAAFLGHRLAASVGSATEAIRVAADAIGTTASLGRSTFELRARATGGEMWEPAVVLVGAHSDSIDASQERTGLAVVSASPVLGPSSRLAPDGDAWVLQPLGLRFVPVGLTTTEMSDLAALVSSADAEPVADDQPILDVVAPATVDVSFDGDHTLAPGDEQCHDDSCQHTSVRAGSVLLPRWALLVRLLGPVVVEAPDGRAVEFERSKACELVAWLATHRDRSTRTAARTALWELDVRAATFANVVSDARRSLARLVAPPEGDEWVGRTMTEALPMHPLVRTDAEILQAALDGSRRQPPDLAIPILQPAVELIVGLPFEGTSYLWPDAEGLSSQFVLLGTSAAAELAAHHLSVGDVAGVFDATGRGLRVLPGHEELIGLRMEAHAQAGDRAGVRNEWEQYERVINADPWSDGEPAPRLVELRRKLLAR